VDGADVDASVGALCGPFGAAIVESRESKESGEGYQSVRCTLSATHNILYLFFKVVRSSVRHPSTTSLANARNAPLNQQKEEKLMKKNKEVSSYSTNKKS
jgi:hypothetical protein